jgi:hypothetical protein
MFACSYLACDMWEYDIRYRGWVAKKDPEDEKLNPKQRNKKLCWCVKVISVAKYKN